MKVFKNIGIERNITDRLLAYRESIGDDTEKSEYYHKLVIRYQKILARNYLKKQTDQSNHFLNYI